jgi:TonB family protein
MIVGGLIILYSVLSIGLPSDIAFLKNKLTGSSEQSSDPLSANTSLPDTTITTRYLAEASISGISSGPSKATRTEQVKSTNKRQIKRVLNPTGFKTPGKKSVYRSQEELSRVINKHNNAIEYCYKKELRTNPTLKGDLDVEFTIDYSGKVKAVRIVRSSIYSKNIEKCIANRIRAWRFKAISQSDGDVKVRQKYIFG